MLFTWKLILLTYREKMLRVQNCLSTQKQSAEENLSRLTGDRPTQNRVRESKSTTVTYQKKLLCRLSGYDCKGVSLAACSAEMTRF